MHPETRIRERFFRQSVERSPDIVLLVDSRGRVLRANAAACRMLGYSPGELHGLTLHDLYPRSGKDRWPATMKKLRTSDRVTEEAHILAKDGRTIPVEIVYIFAELEGKEYAFSFARDITKRKHAQEALQKALAEVRRLKDRLQEESLYLQHEIKLSHNFEEIITQSEAFKKVLARVEQVASTDATVLILGETGTGKELIARAIHNISRRRGRPLVKVNCAALPAPLIESELFGHEKGAFTGAFARKAGRFELADGGTIFLDEIGDLPPELQAKLLHVLQDGEYQRLGSSRSFKVDVRVIAATNRDIKKAIRSGSFREDLYYRLSVFPIHVPPLRERKEDIPLLVKHFIGKYAPKMGKRIEIVPQSSQDRLQAYHWPGNVRELENVIERAVIVSRGSRLRLGEGFLMEEAQPPGTRLVTLEESTREHILKALELTRWRVSGEKGAAKILGAKAPTLVSKMKKLGIKRDRQNL